MGTPDASDPITNIYKKGIVHQVGYLQRLYRDVRSTEYKIQRSLLNAKVCRRTRWATILQELGSSWYSAITLPVVWVVPETYQQPTPCIMFCNKLFFWTQKLLTFCPTTEVDDPTCRMSAFSLISWCTTSFHIEKFCVVPTRCIYMCFVWISEQTAINNSLCQNKWYVFQSATKYVYCTVRTEYLNII
jgi:hypothetical protein